MQIDRCRFGKRKMGLMSKVIMMCGICGSGKTTYAKKKEQEGYIRLSIDEEMWKLYGRKGIDYRFWSKENRNVYKELIQKAGAETELLSTPSGECLDQHFRWRLMTIS